MSRKVIRLCDACEKECKDTFWDGTGPLGSAPAYKYIGWRLKIRKPKVNGKIFRYSHGNGRFGSDWVRLEICNQCANDMFKWLAARKMGVDE